MDKTLQTLPPSQPGLSMQSRVAATPEAAGRAAPAGSSFVSVSGPSELRFPPTRAARASRSRGVFLGDRGEVGNSGRSRWIEVPVALVALAVAAFAVVVCLNASWLVGGPSLGANPGPGIVAAASVAPSFIEPVKLR